MIGVAVARAYTCEGAKVFLARCILAPLDTVARTIFAAGGGGCGTPKDLLLVPAFQDTTKRNGDVFSTKT
jgi:hypothetical protein